VGPRKSTGIVLSLVGFVLIIVSFFLSSSARRAQQQAAERQLAEAYRTMGQGNGTGSGMNVIGSNDGSAAFAAVGGILLMLTGVALFKGKLGSWTFATEQRAAINSSVSQSHPAVSPDTIIRSLRDRHEPVLDQFPDDGLMRDTVECLMRGQKVQAVKTVKDATGCSLEEAKRLSDGLYSAMKRL